MTAAEEQLLEMKAQRACGLIQPSRMHEVERLVGQFGTYGDQQFFVWKFKSNTTNDPNLLHVVVYLLPTK